MNYWRYIEIILQIWIAIVKSKSIKTKFNDKIYAFVIKHAEEFNGILSSDFNIEIDNFINEIAKNLISKMNRMYKIEKQKN